MYLMCYWKRFPFWNWFQPIICFEEFNLKNLIKLNIWIMEHNLVDTFNVYIYNHVKTTNDKSDFISMPISNLLIEKNNTNCFK